MRFRSVGPWVAFLLPALVIVGCQRPPDPREAVDDPAMVGVSAWPDADEYTGFDAEDLVGFYEGDPVVVEEIEGMTAEEVEEAVRQAGGLYLELESERYRLSYAGVQFGGPWALEDVNLTLQVDELDGQSLEQIRETYGIPEDQLALDPFEIEVLDDGEVLQMRIPEITEIVIDFAPAEGTFDELAGLPATPAPIITP